MVGRELASRFFEVRTRPGTTERPSVRIRDLDRAFTNVLGHVVRMRTRQVPHHPTSTSRDVSDQAFPIPDPLAKQFLLRVTLRVRGRPGNEANARLLYRVERHLNLNGCDTSLIWTYSQVGRKGCFYSLRATLHAPRSRYIYHTRTALAITVHLFLSSQPWNKKENPRSKGSESCKRCTRACTSYVASGVENI